MPGYNETMLQGMQGLMGMRRLQDTEQQQDFERRLHAAQLQRQYEQMGQQGQIQDRRLQMGLANQERMNLEFQQRMESHAGDSRQRERLAREAMEQRDKPPLKPGYMRDPSDPQKMTPVPGGPAWRDLSSKHADDLQRLGAFGEVADASDATIERILDSAKKDSGFNPNFGGYNAALITQHMPGAVPGFSQTQNVRADLENLKSNLKAQGASLMRGVGGAPGSITEREWPILEKMIESLSPLMEEKEAGEALRRIQQRFKGMKERSLSNYRSEWGDSPFFKADPLRPTDTGGAGTIPEGVDPKIWKFMTPAEKKLWQK